MKQLSVLVKPASFHCNLRCSYCFYTDVSQMRVGQAPGMMGIDTAALLISRIFAYLAVGDQLEIIFQGGEPTLRGLDFYQTFIGLVHTGQSSKNVAVSYVLQTNGTLLDDSWGTFLKEHHFLVGLSIDGWQDLHDSCRVDVAGQGSFDLVEKGRAILDKYEIPYNVLMVLTEQMAAKPEQIWEFICQSSLEYVQFIPCLAPLGQGKGLSQAVTPSAFVSFYIQLLPLWLEKMKRGNYISIKLFDDIYNQFAYARLTACGQSGRCQLQYVIEADGSIYPCDFYALDEYRMGTLAENPWKVLWSSRGARNFLSQESRSHLHKHQICQNCIYAGFCGGGCRRMQDTIYGEIGKNCAYRQLLNEFLPHMAEIRYALQNLQVGDRAC